MLQTDLASGTLSGGEETEWEEEISDGVNRVGFLEVLYTRGVRGMLSTTRGCRISLFFCSLCVGGAEV